MRLCATDPWNHDGLGSYPTTRNRDCRKRHARPNMAGKVAIVVEQLRRRKPSDRAFPFSHRECMQCRPSSGRSYSGRSTETCTLGQNRSMSQYEKRALDSYNALRYLPDPMPLRPLADATATAFPHILTQPNVHATSTDICVLGPSRKTTTHPHVGQYDHRGTTCSRPYPRRNTFESRTNLPHRLQRGAGTATKRRTLTHRRPTRLKELLTGTHEYIHSRTRRA